MEFEVMEAYVYMDLNLKIDDLATANGDLQEELQEVNGKIERAMDSIRELKRHFKKIRKGISKKWYTKEQDFEKHFKKMIIWWNWRLQALRANYGLLFYWINSKKKIMQLLHQCNHHLGMVNGKIEKAMDSIRELRESLVKLNDE